MKKFQQLVNDKTHTEKLSFQALSKTLGIHAKHYIITEHTPTELMHIRGRNTPAAGQEGKDNAQKPHCQTFRELAMQAKQQHVLCVSPLSDRAPNLPSFTELTLKKDRKDKEGCEFDENTIVCKRQRVRPRGELEGIRIIDSIAIEAMDEGSSDEREDMSGLNTTEKKQVEKEISKITIDLKNKLFVESKKPNELKEVMKEVSQVLEVESERVYSKILHQRATSRGTTDNSTLNSNKSPPKTFASFLSNHKPYSPLMPRHKSNKSPCLSSREVLIPPPKAYKSSTRYIKAQLTGEEVVRVTQFKLEG